VLDAYFTLRDNPDSRWKLSKLYTMQFWYLTYSQVESVFEKLGNTAQAELALVANASDNGITYRCEAKNKALATPLSESVTFHVLCKCLFELLVVGCCW
jgi:hypothetical protein